MGGGTWTEQERTAGLRMNEYAESARRFVWNELADWYLEASKGRLQVPTAGAESAAARARPDSADRDVARSVLVHAFDQALRLLHPIVPFITESLWQRLPGHVDGTLLTRAAWPARAEAADAQAVAAFEHVRAAVVAIRQVRSDNAIAPGTFVDAVLVAAPGSEPRAAFDAESPLIGRLARAKVTVADAAPAEAAAHAVLAGGASVAVPLAGLIDVAKECAKLRDERAALEKQLAALEGRLANAGFTERAPAAVVEGERRKRDEWVLRRGQLTERVRALCGS
ncbi:MAG: class I tRNA ligase family protein [Gemmatimonadaceae bacterium]|nr:class I tRNA ligase family protein [Gemmatimonadaceae bacterium]